MAVGLAIRVAFVLVRQQSVVLNGDAFWYHFQARLVADGMGFLNPYAYFKDGVSVAGADHPPGFVLLLALADTAGFSSPQAQRLLMCILGTGSIGLIGLAARQIASPRAGVVAAGIAAVYPNLWINDGMLMAETPYIAAVAGSLLFAYRYRDEGDWLALVSLSACLALAAMTRPESIMLFPLVVVPLVLARRSQPFRERLGRIAVAAAVPIVFFAPWVAYNLSRFEQPVLISSGAGQTLAVGNCDLTYAGDFLGFYNTQCLLPPQIDPPTNPDASVRDPQYQRIATDYITDHKRELPKVVAARIGRLWHVYRVDQGLTLDGWVEGRSGGPPGSSLRWVREALWSYYALTLLAGAGLLVLRRRRVMVYPLLAQAAIATFVAATTFGVTRYRAGVEVATVMLAAVALDAVLPRTRATPTVEPRPSPRASLDDHDDAVAGAP